MNEEQGHSHDGSQVPPEVIPPGTLPPMTYRDLPEPVSLRRMIGPSIILAGLALGSGEFILWPYITFKTQFVFFWACMLGVVTQYFLNMEISRWSLATGETAVGGLIRLSRHFGWILLLLNIIPWMIPAWAKGAAELTSWMIWGPADEGGSLGAHYATPMAIGGMVVCGLVLTAGPVIYETIERVQVVLVSLVMILVVFIAACLLSSRPDAIVAMTTATVTFGYPDFIPQMDENINAVMLLGALAFAGAGGTTNLGQSNYIRDKGYGMGRFIGRITSPLTGQEEAVTEVGYHFPATGENHARWKVWWRNASFEHFFSFFLTCVICLVLLSLISYVIFYDANGDAVPGAAQYNQNDLGFVWGEALQVQERIGAWMKYVFLIMGVAILLTTEFGVLDVASRISADSVKTAMLRTNEFWSESRLYFCFLWGTIVLGSGILGLAEFGYDVGALSLFKMSACLNGVAMFLYSAALLYMNTTRLPDSVRLKGVRKLVMVWSVLFFGFFSIWVGVDVIQKILA
ncbi:MAG: Nramp family divalent metal transporter [Pirellulaceae bacterium]|jgi:hypothetical protein|nr:Nramp family divalent metal transporter [Pirellulaceae bacterium]MDP7020403.1 Nramp family divalent metal transporter [Pirellulaceae bacterium]